VPAFSQSTDTTRPTITSFQLDLATATANSARMIVTFSEPVTGVDASDFQMNGTLTAAATITGVTQGANAATYHVAFTYTGTSGSLQMAIKTSGTGITDTAGNAFIGGGVAATPAYPVNNAPPADMTLPTLVSFTAPAAISSSPVTLTAVFSEPVTGVTADDFHVSSGASVGSISGSGTTWTIPVTFTGTNAVTVMLVGGATANIRDTATHWFAGGSSNAAVTFTPTSGGGGGLAPVISSPLTASVTAGAVFSYTLTASNAPTTLTATGLPAGLTFTTPAITGAVAAPGIYNITLGAANTSGSDTRTLVLTVNPAPGGGGGLAPVISSPLTASVTAGAAFSYTLTASNSPTTLTATGLPAGLTFSSPTITGAVAIPGIYNITLGAANASGSDTKTLVLTVNAAGGGSGTSPRVISVTPPANGTYVAGQALTFTVTFNAPVTVVTGGSGGNRPFFVWTAHNPSGAVAGNLGVPAQFAAGHFPPPGSCRIWYPNRPAGQQPPPGDCDDLEKSVPPGTWLLSRDSGNRERVKLTVYHATQARVKVASFWYSQSGTLLGEDVSGGSTSAGPSNGRVTYDSGSGTAVLTFKYTVDSDDIAPNGITLGTAIELPSGAFIRDSSGSALPANALALPWPSNPLPGLILMGGSPGAGPGGNKGTGPVVVIKRDDGLLAGQPFTLPATNASGQPITWILVSGNATLNGNVLTPKNRGAVVVRAVVSGGGSAQGSQAVEYRIEQEDLKGQGKAPHRERLSNLSSRVRVSGSEPGRSAIAGFVVTGTSSKPVLVRAVGPGLGEFGIGDAVPAASLQIFDQAGAAIAQNDGWKGDAAVAAASERVGAFKLAPASADSALLLTLPPGAYTAQVGARGNGIALLEVYDATGAAVASTEQLINMSTRGYVDSGDGSLIAGFVVTGDAPKRLLVRGVGAALAGFGVAGALADPVLELYTAGGATLLARNDDWEKGQPLGLASSPAAEIAAAARATGAFPLAAGSKDAAVLITLMPGSYSAVVRGANNSTGAGLIEVYEVPNP
jgi:hypothetical protein